MRLSISVLFCAALLGLTGCSGSDSGETKSAEARVVPAGEKATAGHLTYSIVDSQILTHLGEEASPRVPHDRFVLVQVGVTNSSNADSPIPAVELVDDSGKIYNELTDGTGVTNWLGIIRHVGAGQTERGFVAFDAPAAHYKLKLSDETLNQEVLADLPLSYSHEKINDALIPSADLPDIKPNTAPEKKK